MACSSFNPKRYVVRFEGNNSKKWDGKEVWLDVEVLGELYSENELVDGCKITIPWKSRRSLIGTLFLLIQVYHAHQMIMVYTQLKTDYILPRVHNKEESV